MAAAVAVGLVAAGLGERPTTAELAAGAKAGRLTTASSNRYEYWRVGLGAFRRKPLTGLGAAGFRVEWLRERTIPEACETRIRSSWRSPPNSACQGCSPWE